MAQVQQAEESGKIDKAILRGGGKLRWSDEAFTGRGERRQGRWHMRHTAASWKVSKKNAMPISGVDSVELKADDGDLIISRCVLRGR